MGGGQQLKEPHQIKQDITKKWWRTVKCCMSVDIPHWINLGHASSRSCKGQVRTRGLRASEMMMMLAAAVRAVFSKHGEQQTETVAAVEGKWKHRFFFPLLNLVREISFYKMLCHGVFFFLSLSWETDSEWWGERKGGRGWWRWKISHCYSFTFVRLRHPA